MFCETLGFIEFGLRPRHSVCIFASNSPEWLFSQLGAILAGGISVGIYRVFMKPFQIPFTITLQ